MKEISKTLFKEFSKCSNYYVLDNIYNKKMFSEIDENIKKEYLKLMYDENGNSLICNTDEKLEVMQEYYKEVERVSLKVASKTFKKPFKYEENNLKQKEIRFIDSNGYLFHTYLDGYYEDNEEIYVIEVKATSSNSFMKLGPKVKGELSPIFKKDNNIIYLKEEIVYEKKYQNSYHKLFDRYDDCGKYIYDIAITKFIMDGYLNQNNITKKVKYYLGILNSEYIYDGVSDFEKVNKEEVISFIDMNYILNDYKDLIFEEYNKIINNIFLKKIEDTYSKACKEDCPYKKACFPFLNNLDSVESLLVPKKIKIDSQPYDVIDLINMGYKHITDIPKEYLDNKNHIIQRNCIDSDEEYFNKEDIRNSIKENIEYPIYHLDFEAFQSPLPRFKGEKPYMQSVFQYSIHIQRKPLVCDEKLDNYYFIPNDFLDHRKELVEKMIKTIDLSSGGIVLVYNKNFEYSRIKEFMEFYPEYKKELQNILNHMVDLLDIVRKNKNSDTISFYHKNLHGSYSIKKVLPVFTDMSYNELEVKNGVEAQVAYAKFKYLPKEDIQVLRESLIKYCGQDTYSMFKILSKLYIKSQD